MFDDVIENYRLDYELNKSISLELANSTRQRICCPASSVTGIDWHIGSFGITYATPYLKPLHGLFVLNATGHAKYHNPGGRSIHLVSYTAALDIHIDLNRLVGPQAKH